MIRFVIPAYNEAENIPQLLADLAPVARELGARVIIVDDGSTDGTGEVIREHAQDMHLAVVTHTVNRGLGTAINTGIRVGAEGVLRRRRDRHPRGRHDLRPLRPAARCWSSSSRAPTSSSPRSTRPAARSSASPAGASLASKSVSNTFRYLGGLREMHTLSSLYRVYRAGTLRKAADTYGYLLVREPGFAANVELLLKLYNAGATRRRGADGERLADPQRRVEDAAETDRARLLPGDGRAHGRSHPAAAGLAAGRGDGAPGAARAGSGDRDRARRPPTAGAGRPALMARANPRVGVVGGGVLGTSLALRLAQAGAAVTVLERGPSLGGLAGTFDFGGHQVDRFYHVITPADQRHDRDGGGGRARRPAALHAGRRRLLRRRRDARLQRRRRPAALLAAEPARRACAWAGSSPSASCAAPTRSWTRIPLETWLRRHLRQPGLGADLEAAARLALRRRSLGAAGDLPLGPHAAHVRGARRARGAAARKWATSSAATSG